MSIRFIVRGVEAAIREINETNEKFIPETIHNVLKDVLFNDMLRSAKLNAKGRVLGRRGNPDTGNLARRIFPKIRFSKKKAITVGSLNVDLRQVPYGRIHEEGGVITPKRAQNLTIPFPGIRGFVRDFSDTFVQTSKAGNRIVFQNIGNEIRPLFTLKRQVKIPKRPYLAPAIQKHRSKLERELRRKLNRE